MPEPEKIKKVCSDCKSEDVVADAYAAWNWVTQEWDIVATFDKGSHCNNCGCECRIEDVPI